MHAVNYPHVLFITNLGIHTFLWGLTVLLYALEYTWRHCELPCPITCRVIEVFTALLLRHYIGQSIHRKRKSQLPDHTCELSP